MCEGVVASLPGLRERRLHMPFKHLSQCSPVYGVQVCAPVYREFILCIVQLTNASEAEASCSQLD